MKRLFFALWPDDPIRQQFRKIVRTLRDYGRPVSAMNLHATLVFLGNVDEAQEVAMTEAAANVVVQPMTLDFNQLNFWKKPAVVCLGTERIDPAVSNLVDQLTQAAIQNEIKVDQRPYKPHVTLLRKAKALPDVTCKPILWQADEFCLVESCSTSDGVEYRVIQRWKSAQSPVETPSTL